MSSRRRIPQMMKLVARFGGLLLIGLALRVAHAQETVIRASFLFPEREPVPVNVLAGQSCLVIFDQPIGRLALSNTENADAVPVAPNQIMVNAKASGRARLTAWAKEGDHFVFFDIDVRANLAQIDSQVRALFPKADIRLSQANGSVVMSGNVDPKVASQVEEVIKAAGFKTVNLFTQPVQGIQQVQLQLRLAEVSRNRMQDLGFTPVVATAPGQGGYANPGGGPWTLDKVADGTMFGTVATTLNLFIQTNNIAGFLRALQTQGAIRDLAEPNLIAMNGQQASFLAGGEIPVPILQASGAGAAVTVQWKEYGVRVGFKPTIIDEQHIRLEIEPEVSTLDYSNAIKLNGYTLPALRTRRAKTGVELRDGQSFGIAGLLDNSESKSLSKMPVISSVPVLGNLFKSKSFQKNETELVFIVTAKITEPLNPDAVPNLKGLDKLKGTTTPLDAEVPTPPSTRGPVGDSGVAPAPGDGPAGAPAADEKQSEPRAAEPAKDAPGTQKPLLLPPPQKQVTRVDPKDLHWKLLVPETSTLTAQGAANQN